MSRRNSSEIIQCLRSTLRQLKEIYPCREDQPIRTELKRILLLRIAEFEPIGAGVKLSESKEKEQPKSPIELREDDSESCQMG